MANVTYVGPGGQTISGSSHAGYANMMSNAGFTAVASPAPSSSSSGSSSSNSSGGGSSSGGQSTSSVNNAYQQYYGRPAEANELAYWTTRPASELNTALSTSYQQTAGTSYDGSPIVPGGTKTANQIAASTSKNMTSVEVNNLYTKYFNRPATSEEAAYWTTRPASELDAELSKTYEQNAGIKYDGSPIEEGNTYTANQIKIDPKLAEEAQRNKAIQETIDYIKTLPYSDSQKAILTELASGNYLKGKTFPTESELTTIIQDAATNAEADLNPYYERMTAENIADIKKGFEDIRTSMSNYAANTEVDYQKQLTDTKAKLRASGRTFSGKGRELIGAKSAIGAADAGQQAVEGTVNAANRVGYEQKQGELLSTARDFGVKGERLLGTEAVRNLNLGNLTTPYTDAKPIYNLEGGVGTNPVETGSLALDRLKAIEESKWSRVGAKIV